MGFMDRLFARHGSQEKVDEALYQVGGRDKRTDPRPWDDRSSLKVVGESHYQDALTQITRRSGSEKVSLDNIVVVLVCEPDNPYDKLAVKVVIDGLHVGYLPKGSARTYHRRIEREGGQVTVAGYIGALEDGMIGVKVHVPDDHPIQRPLNS